MKKLRYGVIFPRFYLLQLIQLLIFYYQNQISIVIPLLTSLTDPFKNKMKEEKYKAFMTK